MTNANDPITPHLTYDNTSGHANGFIEGLTKREYFSAMAMQGLLAYGWNVHEYDEASKCSVKAADALITALNAK